jgi:hypothetical protein
MKKVSVFVLAAIISIAFVATVFAQAPTGTTEKKETTTTTTTTTPEKKEITTTTKTTKSKGMKFYGKVISMDTDAKMMTVKGKKGDMTFDVSSAEMKSEVKAGDKVYVKYVKKDGKMMASVVKKTESKKMKTKTITTTTEEKTEETAAPAK